MTRKNIVILGAGGLAREIAWLIRDLNRVAECYRILGYVISDLAHPGAHDSRDTLRGDYDWLVRNSASIDAVTVGIGYPAARLKVAHEVRSILPRAEWPVLVHPSAIFDAASARFGEGVQLCAGVIGTVNLTFAPFAFCNLGCTLGHESTIGAGSVVNPCANISGGVVMEESVLIGTGAQILQYRRIGAGASVGAGAVVTKDVLPGLTVIGTPARPLVKVKKVASALRPGTLTWRLT